MNRRALTAAVAAAALVALAGCSSPGMRRIEQNVAAGHDDASARVAEARTQEREPYFEIVDELWIGTRSVADVRGPDLPATFGEHAVFSRTYPVTLNIVAEHISTNHGIPVSVMPDALVAAQETSYDAVREMQNRSATLGSNAAGAATGAQGGNGAAGTFLVQYRGTLKGLLDQVTARTGTAWRYGPTGVQVFALDTRVFKIHALPVATTMSATVGNQATGGSSSGSGGGGGGETDGGSTNVLTSGNTTSLNAELDLFAGVAESVQKMLTPKGSMVATRGQNTLTVTDTPASLDRVAALIEQLNYESGRQVALDVRVYAVERRAGEDYGIDWNMIYNTLNGRYNISALGSSDADIDSSGMQVTVIDPTSRIADSSVLLRALSTQGELSTVTTASLISLSGQSIPVQVGEETGYVQSSEQTVTPNVGVTTTRTVGVKPTGFSMQVMPILTTGDELLLQLHLNLSQLRALQTFGQDAGAVQVPIVDSRHMLQSVRLKTGQTLILSGFEQTTSRADYRGIGSAKFSAAGGGRKGDERRTVLVITVTPRVMG